MGQEQEIAPETRRAIVEQEIALWRNTRYLTDVRLRVLRRVGGTDEQLAAQIAELERIERTLDALAEERAAIG
jgi:hypothetical protein